MSSCLEEQQARILRSARTGSIALEFLAESPWCVYGGGGQ